MKKIVIQFLLIAGALGAQNNIVPSNTYVRTCLSDIECSSINSSSFIFYDESQAKFYIKLDFNLMRTGQDSVDFWLDDLSGTNFYFKAPLSKEEFPPLSSYNAKNIKLTGQSFLNNIWHNQTVDITIFRAQHDMMNNSVNASAFDAYKVNFSFSFQPKDYAIHKKPKRLSNTVFVGVGGGHINVLQRGMESAVGEAFDH